MRKPPRLTPVPPEQALQEAGRIKRIDENLLAAGQAFNVGDPKSAWLHLERIRKLCGSPEKYVEQLLKLRQTFGDLQDPHAYNSVYFTSVRALLECVQMSKPGSLGVNIFKQDVTLYERLKRNGHEAIPAVLLISSQLAVALLEGKPTRDIVNIDKRLEAIATDALWHSAVLSTVGARVAIVSPEAVEPLQPIIGKLANIERSVEADMINNVMLIAQAFRRGENVEVKLDLLRQRFIDAREHGFTWPASPLRPLLEQSWQLLACVAKNVTPNAASATA